MEPRRPLPPPPSPPRATSLKAKLARGFALVLALGFIGGGVYLYTHGTGGTPEEAVLENGLNRLGFSLWSTGTAPGVNMVDPDLNKTIEKLHGRYRTVPELSIQPVEGVPGERVGTHVIHFLSGPRRILSVVVNVDLAAGTADVLSHTTPLQSELEEDAAPDPAEELLKNFGKRKPPTETGAPPEGKPAGETIGDLLENRVNSDPRGTAPLPEAALPAEPEAPPPAAPEKVSEEPRKGDE